MVSTPTNFLPISFVIGASILSFSSHATNGLFPAGNGVVAHGMGGAGIANSAEAISMVDNPAHINNLGNIAGGNIHFYYPELSANLTGDYVDSEVEQTITPQFAATYGLDNSLGFGFAVTVLGGAGSDYPDTLVTDRAGITAGGLIFSPSVSYKITSEASIGFSFQYAYEEIETDGFPAQLGGFGDNKGSTTGYGYKLGYLINASESLSFGLVYQSKIDVGEIDDHCSGTGMFTLYKAAGGDCSLDMPEIYSIGLKYQATEQIKLLTDVQYIVWESVDVIKDVFGWENRYVYKVGAEYQATPLLAVRAGYNHSKAPQAKDRVADNVFAGALVEDHYTLGLSYQAQQDYLFSLYYSYGAENEIEQSGAVSNPTLSPITKLKMSEQVIGLGFDLNF